MAVVLVDRFHRGPDHPGQLEDRDASRQASVANVWRS
jgi:hypothetical protein